MGRCAACGAEIQENIRFCPHCGARIPEAAETKPRDYWAEKLQTQEDWTEDVDEEELMDLNDPEDPNEDPEDLRREMGNLKPTVRRGRRLLSVLLLAAAIAAVLGGFYLKHLKKVTPVPGSGMYYGCVRTFEGESCSNEAEWAELQPDSTLLLYLTGRQMEGRWILRGTEFIGILPHRDLYGSLQDGVLRFEMDGVSYLFASSEKREAYQFRETTEETEATEAPDRYNAWEGDYFGVLRITEGTGGWEGNSGETYGVCGQIRVEGQQGRVALWNEKNKWYDRFCMADVLFAEGDSPMGKMYVQWGKFYNMELPYAHWVVEPGKSPWGWEDALYLQGTYLDAGNPEDGFLYEILLRPWGKIWELPETEKEDAAFLPPAYYDWYLPLQEAGMPMPEHF